MQLIFGLSLILYTCLHIQLTLQFMQIAQIHKQTLYLQTWSIRPNIDQQSHQLKNPQNQRRLQKQNCFLSNCKTCIINASSSLPQCTQCFPGFYLKSNKFCGLCSRNCLTCSNSAQNCTLCSNGQLVGNDNCKLLLFMDSFSYIIDKNSKFCFCQYSCKQCFCQDRKEKCVSNYSYPNTQQCSDTYFINNLGNCSKCQILNCKTCSNTNLCNNCVNGYYLLNNTCEQCPSSCSLCSPKNISFCLECSHTYYLRENQCLKCNQGCKLCDKDGCFECLSGYYVTAYNESTYLICSKIDYSCNLPCINCSSSASNVCNNCINNYFLLSSSSCSLKQQGHCPSNSLYFNGFCNLCNRNHYLSNQSCIRCNVANCQSCLKADTCLGCKQGYTLIKSSLNPLFPNNKRCQTCLRPCQTCVEYQTQCVTCVPGYSLYGWKCITQEYVEFNLEFNVTLEQFLQSSVFQFRNKMLAYLGSKYSQNYSLFTYYSIGPSSKIVGRMENPENNTCELLKSIITELGTGKKILKLQIINSTITNKSKNNVQNCQIINVGLIVGLVVGLTIFILGLIVVMILIFRYYKRRLETRKQTQSQAIVEQQTSQNQTKKQETVPSQINQIQLQINQQNQGDL